ncbi:MAG: hypothetical protein ABWX60_00460 [Aeromicrobium sp.]
MRVLRVEGTILMSPGRLVGPSAPPPKTPADTSQLGLGLEQAAALLDENRAAMRDGREPAARLR